MTLQLDDDRRTLLAPCRLDVFASRQNGKRTVGVGWQGWNPDPVMEERMARLKGSGSFYWPNALRAYLAAKVMMQHDPTIHQVKIETISAVPVARLYR